MLTNNFLLDITKYLNGEVGELITHLAFSSDAITPGATDTSVSGQLGSRISISNSRSSTEPIVTFSGLRSGAVASSSGDYINLGALFTDASMGTLMAEAVVPSILHTSDFDFEVDWSVTIGRK